MSVSAGGQNLEHAVADGEKTHVEGSASEIKDEDVLFLSLLLALVIQSISDGSSRWLVNDPEDVETRARRRERNRTSSSLISEAEPST
jgi:hypothetical protein